MPPYPALALCFLPRGFCFREASESGDGACTGDEYGVQPAVPSRSRPWGLGIGGDPARRGLWRAVLRRLHILPIDTTGVRDQTKLAASAEFAKGRPKLTRCVMMVRSADPVFWNNLHNKDFWEEMPALVRDGAAFLQVRFWLSQRLQPPDGPFMRLRKPLDSCAEWLLCAVGRGRAGAL